MADPYRLGLMNEVGRMLESISCHANNKIGLVNDMKNLKTQIPFDKITVPYHNTHGTSDKVMSHEVMTKQACDGIKGTELELVEGGSHTLYMHEQGKEVMRKQVEFIRKHLD